MSDKIVFRPVDKGRSFFRFVETYCLEEQDGVTINKPFHRLCSLARKMDVKTAIIEELSQPDDPIITECIALKTHCGVEPEFKIFRITFVKETVDSFAQVTELDDDAFLTTTTVINFKIKEDPWRSYVFSAICREPKIFNHLKFGTIPLLNNYLHVRRTFECAIQSGSASKNFSITGSFFSQQNKITSVCAHAALCVTINNLNLEGSELIYPERVNEIMGVNHTSRRLGPEDVSKEDTLKVLERFGLTIDWRDFDANPDPINYRDFVYQHIESGSPVLLVFSIDDRVSHVVPVLGHTLNTDVWAPEAVPAYLGDEPSRFEDFYASVRAWVDHFIIHDDNFGMYFCLPADTFSQTPVVSTGDKSRLHVWLAAGVIPSGVITPGWEAEAACTLMVTSLFKEFQEQDTSLDEWNKRILSSLNMAPSQKLLIRTFLVSRHT
ncbi:MAG: hypothetical protein A4E63_01539 [Syntrophorhabdus sp. PtaU1.Bin050]|nr:MAG: hypothetical protein A4E63_01539 [Syntrophorhabdus sp. PtaU1.Bin050]